MQLYFGVFRDGKSMEEGLKKLEAIGERVRNTKLADTSNAFNTARIEALELALDKSWDHGAQKLNSRKAPSA